MSSKKFMGEPRKVMNFDFGVWKPANMKRISTLWGQDVRIFREMG